MSSAARRPKAILPWWQLALVLAACATGVWLLLPDDSGLIDDLLRDGRVKEARRALERISPSKRARHAAHYRFLEIRASRLELPPAPAPADFTRFWREATTAWRETGYASNIFLEIVPLVPRLPAPAEAWAALSADVTRAPAPQRARFSNDFIALALASNLPHLAAEIYAATHPAPTRSADEALELARLWQLAGRSVEALASLGEIPALTVIARRITLLRSLNRNREALDLLRGRADATPEPDATLTEELAQVALAAGEPATAAPYLRRFLTAQPRDLAAHRRLRDLLLAAAQPTEALESARSAADLSARDPADLRELARIHEYISQPAPAFEVWLELLLSPAITATSPDTLPALARLVALNPGLYRDAAVASALAKLVPLPSRPDYTLQLANLSVALGLFNDARVAFDRYFAVVPTDVNALVDFAHLHRELYRFADAEAVLRRALALRPGDLALRREIAETLVAQDRNAEALTLYRQLAAESSDEEILGPYVRLAESLGRYEDFTLGLRRRIDSSPTPAARDFVLLAYGYELADDPVRRQAALAEGLRRASESDDVRLQLAFALSAERKYTEAQATLALHSGLQSDAPAALLYLELLRLNNDTAAERRYLATPVAPALAHDESILERLARAHEALRDYPAAELLWRELVTLRPSEFEHTASLARVVLLRNRTADARQLLAPYLAAPTPAILKLAAQLASAAGDHRAAERHQLAYLALVDNAPADDWGALGDIRLSSGDRTGAKRAYAKALLRLQTKISTQGGPP